MPRSTDVAEPLGWGSGEAVATEREFFMSDACGSKWNPWLVCPGAKIWTPGLKEGSVGRTVVLPMLKLASGSFSICTWCWAGVHENPQKGMFPSWMMEEEKKKSWTVVLWNHEKPWLNLWNRDLNLCRGERFSAGLWGLPSTNTCSGASAVPAAVRLWKASGVAHSHPGEPEGLCFSDQESFSSSLSRAEGFSQPTEHLKFILSDSPFLIKQKIFGIFLNPLLLSKRTRVFL